MRTRLITLLFAAVVAALASVAVAVAHDVGSYGSGHSSPSATGTTDGVHKADRVRTAKRAKSAFLNGKAEIGPDGRRRAGDLDATGTAGFQLVDSTTICYGFTLDNADAPSIVHIHRGAPGKNGPPAIAFANVPKNAAGQPSGDPGTSSGCKTLTTHDELAALKQLRKNPRGFYVNMHTGAFPNGAVRGQLSNLAFSNG